MRILLALLFVLSPHAGAGEQRWVMVTTSYGEYAANLDANLIDPLLAGTHDAPFIRLKNPFWYDATMSPVFVSDAESKGVRYGFDGTVWLRTRDITRISEMDPGHVEALLEARMLRQRIKKTSP